MNVWQARIVWTNTFWCCSRDLPTIDGRIIERDTIIGRKRLPVPVWIDVRVIGRVTFLNEADDGTFWSTVELDVDPSTLPTGLYPQIDLTAPVDVVTRMGLHAKSMDFLSMRLGTRPAWPDQPPVT